MAEVGRSKLSENSHATTVRAFLEADDGKEFVMSNLVRVHPGEVPHPLTGVPTPGQRLFERYGREFVKILFRHGGHPLLVMRKVGGYVDSWETAPDPGWHIVGAMRYRSRRDLMRLALSPELQQVHWLKMASTAMTFSFPSQVMFSLAWRPRLWLALVLALLAALVHLASVISLLSR